MTPRNQTSRLPDSFPQMEYFAAYGLALRSAIPLPELPRVGPDEQQPTVDIRLGEVVRPPGLSFVSGQASWADGEGIGLVWEGVGSFRVQGDRQIVVDPDPMVTSARLRLFLLGAVMGILLQRRGNLVLHASAAVLPAGGVAFLGGKGWGKSTMAAWLTAQGHPLITDDVLAVDLRGERPLVRPALPQIKLWPDAVSATGHILEELPRVHPDFDKRDLRVNDSMSSSAAPLAGIFLLGKGAEPAIELFHGHQAVMVLMSNLYGARFGEEILAALGKEKVMAQCAKLARRVPVCRLVRPVNLDLLPDIAGLLKSYLADKKDDLDLQRAPVR